MGQANYFLAGMVYYRSSSPRANHNQMVKHDKRTTLYIHLMLFITGGRTLSKPLSWTGARHHYYPAPIFWQRLFVGWQTAQHTGDAVVYDWSPAGAWPDQGIRCQWTDGGGGVYRWRNDISRWPFGWAGWPGGGRRPDADGGRRHWRRIAFINYFRRASTACCSIVQWGYQTLLQFFRRHGVAHWLQREWFDAPVHVIFLKKKLTMNYKIFIVSL